MTPVTVTPVPVTPVTVTPVTVTPVAVTPVAIHFALAAGGMAVSVIEHQNELKALKGFFLRIPAY